MNTLSGHQSKRSTENTGFTCAFCGKAVVPHTSGSYRNHCPHCLHSLHVDNTPGDRASGCRGLMRPVGVRYNSRKGWQLVHRCEKCGAEKVNRTAQDGEMPDDMDEIIKLFR